MKTTRKTPPPETPFHRWFVLTVNGRKVEPGTEVTIHGHGRMRFVCGVTNVQTGAEWIDVMDKNRQIRSFHIDQIKRVHYKNKFRRA